MRSLLLALAVAGLQTSLVAAGNCDYGRDTCAQGYVWREANADDHICVTPQTRSQAAADNEIDRNRPRPTGGAYGPDTCAEGFVWREANAADHVCVSPATRDQTAQDNAQSPYRQPCNCGSGYTKCTQQWFGTAPFCSGKCPSGWRLVNTGKYGLSCEASRAGRCIECIGSSGRPCQTGHKVLCEQECVGVVQQP